MSLPTHIGKKPAALSVPARSLKRRGRRSLAVVLSWENGDLRATNFLTGEVSHLSPEVLPLLHAFENYVSLDSIANGSETARTILRRLVDSGVLVLEGTSRAEREDSLARSWKWGIEAKHFFFATNSVQFETNDEAVWRRLENKRRTIPPPSPFKEFKVSYHQLPNPRRIAAPLGEVLADRRTCRGFARNPISLEYLATLLGLTWGATAVSQNQSLGDFVLKTSPSGGARHPTEVYALVSRVTGLRPGVYHYSSRAHALGLLKAVRPARLARRLCADQLWVEDAAVTFFMTSVVARSMWKYEHSHALRVLLLDAGHLGQTFHLVWTALGLGPFTTAAFNGEKVADALEIDGIQEVAVYAAAAGWPLGSPRPPTPVRRSKSVSKPESSHSERLDRPTSR